MDSLDPKNGGAPRNEYQKYFDIMNNLNKKNAQNGQSIAPEVQPPQPKANDSMNLSQIANMNFSDFHSQSTPGSVQMNEIQPGASSNTGNAGDYMESVSSENITPNMSMNSAVQSNMETQTDPLPNFQSYSRGGSVSPQSGTVSGTYTNTNTASQTTGSSLYQSNNIGGSASPQSGTVNGTYTNTNTASQTTGSSLYQSYNSGSSVSPQSGTVSGTYTNANAGRQPSGSSPYQSNSRAGSAQSGSVNSPYAESRNRISTGSNSYSGSYESTQSASNQRGLYADYRSDGFGDTSRNFNQSSYDQALPMSRGSIFTSSDSPRSESTPSRYGLGALGAVIGSIPGIALLVLLGSAGYVAAVTGIVLFLGVFYLYAFLSHNNMNFNKLDLGIVIGVCIVGIFFGVKASYVFEIQKELPEYSFWSVYFHLSEWLSLAGAKGGFYLDLFLTYLFSAVGALKFFVKK